MVSWLGGVFLVVCGLISIGWRYGFTPLPGVVGGNEFTPLENYTWLNVTPSNCWYWGRELDRTLRTNINMAVGRGYFHFLESWPSAGTSRNGYERIDSFITGQPALDRCLEGLLSSPDNRRPASLTPRDVFCVHFLSRYPLWLASGSEAHGDVMQAFDHLLNGWRGQARHAPSAEFPELFDERQGEQVNALHGKSWRRLALTGPALPLDHARRLLADLASVTNSLPSLEDSYTEAASRALSLALASAHPNWRRVRGGFNRAFFQMEQEGFVFLYWLITRIVGPGTGYDLRINGIRNFSKPAADLVDALQKTAARPRDVQRFHAACLSRTLAAIRSGEITRMQQKTAYPGRVASLEPSFLHRYLDRPAVWGSAVRYPDPAQYQACLNWWRVDLESCRLALALRAYYNLHGESPDRLERLVPEILPAVPIDPFTGQPFRYQLEGGLWRFWSAGPAGTDPTPEDADLPPQRVFRSTEFR